MLCGLVALLVLLFVSGKTAEGALTFVRTAEMVRVLCCLLATLPCFVYFQVCSSVHHSRTTCNLAQTWIAHESYVAQAFMSLACSSVVNLQSQQPSAHEMRYQWLSYASVRVGPHRLATLMNRKLQSSWQGASMACRTLTGSPQIYLCAWKGTRRTCRKSQAPSPVTVLCWSAPLSLKIQRY